MAYNRQRIRENISKYLLSNSPRFLFSAASFIKKELGETPNFPHLKYLCTELSQCVLSKNKIVYTDKFALEFEQFPEEEQEKITDFIVHYHQYGLNDFSQWRGKLAMSWSGNNTLDNRTYALCFDMWHYHIGLPFYERNQPKYETSRVVLHFRWREDIDAVALVDMYDHYRADGSFHIPSIIYNYIRNP